MRYRNGSTICLLCLFGRLTDPTGKTFSPSGSEIDYTFYAEIDQGPPAPCEVYFVYQPDEGRYNVSVIPNPDALPTDTYSLEVTLDDETAVLAANIPISDVPDKPHVIQYVPDKPHVIQCTETGINVAPIADAGEDQIAYGSTAGLAAIALDGSGSSDPDGDDLTYTWSWIIEGEPREATGVDPTIELPIGEHIVDLVVNDRTTDSEPDQIVITVLPVTSIDIDIYPNRTPNPVYLSRNYTIYVAVLGDADFDVTSLDPSSVRFGLTGTEASSVRAPMMRDLNRDGFLDAMG